MPKRKTPKELANVLMTRHEQVLDHCDEMLRVKRTVELENQAEHIRNRTPEEMIAFVNGYNACLEAVMHEFGCYAGFSYAGPTREQEDSAGNKYKSRSLFDPGEYKEAEVFYKTDITQAPRFAEWRKMYYTNGIKGG